MNNHYYTETIEPRTVRTTCPTKLYNVAYVGYDEITSNPVADVSEANSFVAVAICHHNAGYDFYLEDITSTIAYNKADCEEYDPDAPVVEPEAPSSTLNITAPYTAPNREPYTLVKALAGYRFRSDIEKGREPALTLEAGNYLTFNQVGDLRNVTRVAGQSGFWINAADNFPDPEPVEETEEVLPVVISKWPGWNEEEDLYINLEESVPTAIPDIDWHATYRPFVDPHTGELTEVMYAAIRNSPVKNIEGRFRDSYLPNGDLIAIAGTLWFEGKLYGRSAQAAARFRYDCVLMEDVDLEDNVYGTTINLHDKKALGIASTRDNLALITGHIEAILDRYKQRKNNREIKK